MAARLDLGKVVVGAFLVPWWRRQAFARALAIPVALMIGLSAVFYYFALSQVPWYAALVTNIVYGMLFTLFAVTCHRLVLLDPESVAAEWRLRWTGRETRFLLWILGSWLVALAATLPLFIAGGEPEWGYRSNATAFEWLLVSVLAMALFAVEIAAVSISYRELTAA